MSKLKDKFEKITLNNLKISGRLNLRGRLFLSYFIPVSLILITAGVLILFVADRGIKRNLQKEMEVSVESVKLMIKNSLDLSIRNHLRGIAEINNDIVEDFYRQYKKGLLTEAEAKKKAAKVLLSQKIGKTGYIFVWDIKKAPETIPLAVHPFIQGRDVSDTDFVRRGAEIKNGYMSYAWKNPGEVQEREKVMYLSHFKPWNWVIAASSYRSEFTELISISDFSEKISSIKFGAKGYYFILNSRGDVIIHPYLTGNFYNTADKEGRFFVKEMCERKNGEITYFWPEPGETEPRKKLSIFRYIDDFDWILISSSYPDEENTTLAEIGFIVFSSLVLLIIILSAVTYISGSRIIKPLKGLMERLREGAAGNYSLYLPVMSDDELGELAMHFNSFIEQLKIHREELFSARNYLGNIINSLPSILSAVDEEGNIKLWNKGAELFTGITAAEAESGNIYRLFPFLADFKDKIDDTITAKSVTEFQFRTKSANNENRELRISIYPFSQEEMNIAVIRMDDITEDVRKDSQLIQAQKMEIVGTLAGGLAHDFNNVLAGIIGTISLMKSRTAAAADEEKNSKYLSIIEISAKRAAEIVNQLLVLSRKNEPLMEPVDLNNSLENVMIICRNSLDKSIVLLPEYYQGSAVTRGSAAQIEQVILNLCVNSAHAMTIMRGDNEARGGKLSASISKIKADRVLTAGHQGMIENSDYLVLKVSDTGVGISREYQKQIFDPFFTTKSKENGTGLGLSMVYNIIKAHGGFIDLYSEPGRGTTFTVYLPAASGEALSAEINPVNIDLLRGSGEILIIDDEETVRDMARGILEECGYTVHTAVDGNQGIDFFRSNKEKIDLIILDMSMPGLSGRDVFIELRKLDERVPVLLSSGFRQDSMVQETITLGVDDFIQKPYSLKDLAEKVKELVTSSLTSRNH